MSKKTTKKPISKASKRVKSTRGNWRKASRPVPPKRQTRLDAFKQELHKWLHIEDDSYVDIVFGVAFANRLDAKPVWTYVVAPSGGGKTEVVQAWDGHPSIYLLSHLTPHTLISGQIVDERKPDPSLLPKLDGKVLVVKDFTRLLTGKYDAVKEVMGQLRDIYDGSAREAFGTGKDKEYSARFGLVAAVTGVIDKHVRLLAPLGERFVICRLPETTREERKARTTEAAQNRPVSEQEAALKKAAHHVLDLDSKPATMPDDFIGVLVDVADFVAVARTPVSRDGYTKTIEHSPEPEYGTRIVKQLVCLAQGIAMARQRDAVTTDEIKLVCKVALDCIPPGRLKLLQALAEHDPQRVNTSTLAEELSLPASTLTYWLDDLYALKLVGRRTVKPSGYSWKLKDVYAKLLRRLLP